MKEVISTGDLLKSLYRSENIEDYFNHSEIGLPSFSEYINDVEITTLSGIENLVNLNNVGVWNMPQIDLSPLTTLPNLETVTFTEDMRDAAQALTGSNIDYIPVIY
jgi:hypothetical protein